jgi:hypothetical protein
MLKIAMFCKISLWEMGVAGSLAVRSLANFANFQWAK